MEENAIQNINHNNYNSSRLNFCEFNNNLIKIFVVGTKIIVNIFPYIRNEFFKSKNESIMTPIKNKSKKIVNDKSKKKLYQIKKIKNNINNNYTTTINYTIFTLINFILINFICQIKCNIFNSFYFQYSKITLKIKGIGESEIFGKGKYKYFRSINYLKEIYINGIPQDEKAFSYQFNQTYNFVELIWEDNIVNCSSMFFNCSNITEINLSSFNTSQVTNMDRMFNKCHSLTSVNLSNLDTSKVVDMRTMFSYCVSLTSIDLSYFDTSQVTDMSWMFEYCSSLTSLNLSNFNTSKVKRMFQMFYNSPLLTSINLSNFDTSQVTNMSYMFDGCISLEYINLYNFVETKLSYATDMFNNTPENFVICINENTTKEYILNKIRTKSCYTIYCGENWKSKQKKIINDTNKCIESCDNSSQYIYEYNGKCYENCLNGFLYDENNKTNKCKCELDQCLECPNVALNKNLCTKCNTNYYQKEKDPSNIGEYINCYNESDGYYLENNIYKECYYTCKTCNLSGNNLNNNCIECKDNYPMKIIKNNYTNCYENCSYYHFFDNDKILHCTIDLFSPNEYPNLNEDTKECFKNNIQSILKDLIISRINITENMTKSEEIDYNNNILKIIKKRFTENYDTSELDSGNDEVIKFITNSDDFIPENKKIIYTLTTTKNQKKEINDNITTIDLGKCEIKLKNEYNISINESLYILKIDFFVENIQKLEYEVYYNFSSNNLTKLNLTVCKGIKIDISIPKDIPINELDKYNKSSGFYNDICYIFTNDRGTDESLEDRRNNYKNKNISICEEDCDFTKYNSITKKVFCSCSVKENLKTISEIKINKQKLFSNFKDIRNIANFKMLSCIKLFFNTHNIFKNSANYIFIMLLILNIISIFIFSLYDYKKIQNFINNNEEKNNKKKNLENIMTTNNEKNKIENINKNSTDNKKFKIKIKKKVKMRIKIVKKIKNNRKILDNSHQTLEKNSQNLNNKKLTFEKLINKEKLENLNDFELNELNYEDALKNDKRTFGQLYISSIKRKNLLLFSFFLFNDYNSRIIKIFIFFFTFTINLIVSAMFYSDSTMHKIYVDYGKFDFIYQLPKMIYSLVISSILETLLNFLGIYEKDISELKKNKKNKENKENKEKTVMKIKIKIIIFFILINILLFLFWIYLGCFCAVYKNTQIHLLKEVLSSFGISLIAPFFIVLLPCIFRVYSLKDKDGKRLTYFKFSNFLNNF